MVSMTTEKGVLVSGIKPTGYFHIGNYFGMVRQFASMQEEYDSRFAIADMHALTTLHDPKKMGELTRHMLAAVLASGIDPQKTSIYLQSQMPEVAELSWMFSCLTTMPYLSRAHAYKDAVAKDKDINVGTFNYPLLMASDILINDASAVPVGADQKQHLEIAQDTAEKFNRTFGETFIRPEPVILEPVGTIPGTDGQKMSKSYGNTIEMFAEDEDIEKAVMGIPTDSKGVEEPKDADADKVFALHKLFTPEDALVELRVRYEEGGIGYKESKEMLIESMKRVIAPMRESYKDWLGREADMKEILEKGLANIYPGVEEKMREVRKKVGLRSI